MNRRGFLTGLTSLIAAPAIIKVAGIMPVKMVDWEPVTEIQAWERVVLSDNEIIWTATGRGASKSLRGAVVRYYFRDNSWQVSSSQVLP